MVGIVRTEWSGTSGGPGLTQLAIMGGTGLSDITAQTAANAMRKFWDDIKSILPDELKLTVSPIVDIYDDASGELIDSETSPTTPAVVTGTASGGYAGGAGLKVNWNTGIIRNGRRVRGSTYIVPAAAICFSTTGTVVPGTATLVNTAASTLLAALDLGVVDMVVWSRPLIVGGTVTRTGAVSLVASGSCSSKSAILRGRRD